MKNLMTLALASVSLVATIWMTVAAPAVRALG